MDRKAFLKSSGLAAAALLGASGAVQCRRTASAGGELDFKKSFRWKMVTTWPKNFPGLGTGANLLAEIIQKMSGGRIRVRVYAAGELVPAFETFDAVSGGTAELGHGAAYYWKGKVEAAQFFAAVPFGLNAQDTNAWVQYGGGQELWDELYKPFNLKPFLCGNTGAQMGGWFNREVRSLADFNGLKIRMPGLGGDVLRRAGATVVTLPGGEIFQALQSGAIDAAEWVGPYNDLASGFYKAARYYYWPGWQEPGTAMELIVNREAYESLPRDLQAIVKYACAAANDAVLAESSARNATSLIELVEKHRVQLRRFPDEALKKLEAYSQETVADIAKKDPLAQRIFDSYMKFRKGAFEWDRIGEGGFALARSLTTTETK